MVCTHNHTTDDVQQRPSATAPYSTQYEYAWQPIGSVVPCGDDDRHYRHHRHYANVIGLWVRQLGRATTPWTASWQFAVEAPCAVTSRGAPPLFVVVPAHGGDGWLSCGDRVKSVVSLTDAWGGDFFRVVDVAPLYAYNNGNHHQPWVYGGNVGATLHSPAYGATYTPLGTALSAPPRGAVGSGRWDIADLSRPSTTAYAVSMLARAGMCCKYKGTDRCRCDGKRRHHHHQPTCCDQKSTATCGCEKSEWSSSSSSW